VRRKPGLLKGNHHEKTWGNYSYPPKKDHLRKPRYKMGLLYGGKGSTEGNVQEDIQRMYLFVSL
jgi:hypothetical protein